MSLLKTLSISHALAVTDGVRRPIWMVLIAHSVSEEENGWLDRLKHVAYTVLFSKLCSTTWWHFKNLKVAGWWDSDTLVLFHILRVMNFHFLFQRILSLKHNALAIRLRAGVTWSLVKEFQHPWSTSSCPTESLSYPYMWNNSTQDIKVQGLLISAS